MPARQTTLAQLATTSVAAGLTAAIVEMIFVLPIQAMLGASPLIVFQSIASGALGRAAFTGGLYAASLGVAVHLFVSLVAAAIFVFAASRWDVLIRKPVMSGIIFGVMAYIVMTFVVVPLSAIGFRLPKSLPLFLASFGIHLFAFGLPISLASRLLLSRSAGVKPLKAYAATSASATSGAWCS
ncbi:MAG: hypothetical protein HY243_14110 [Proteobacteria bacterium]|nr:hypothetical protein [Pseudomonadota bacterium]